MRYLAELSNGKLIEINWISYELLQIDHGWVHRLREPGLAIIFKLRKRKWKSR